ncbi:MAG: type II toxin-antitoxin system death-on-curing family toxin [Chloroflexi bacterium]|nr:MAG: type II toxin-antitoxin system death-on-curing family toxin [Chloroflexota bacterium]
MTAPSTSSSRRPLVLFAEIRGLTVYADADIAEQAATLLWGIAENQPFVDGNKRIALVVTLTFLELNGCTVDLSEDERVELMYEIAEGLTVEGVTKRIRAHLVARPPIDESEPE